MKSDKKIIGFTLAEVLITLGIIGIVAVMTMPILIGNYKKHVTVVQLKKAYTVLSQMVLRSQEDNGSAFFSNSQVDAATTKNFFEQYWLPYFNNPVVSSENTYPYGVDSPFTGFNGQKGGGVKTAYSVGRIYFTTADGTSYSVCIMYWDIVYDEDGKEISSTARYSSYQEVAVDLNGIKPPNIFGKDVFIFQVFFDKSIVKPLGYNKSVNQINANCNHTGYGNNCAAKIMNDGWKIKSDYPW